MIETEKKPAFPDQNGPSAAVSGNHGTRTGIIPKIRKMEAAFFCSPFAWIFGYIQKYLARDLYRTQLQGVVDDSWESEKILDVGCGHGTLLLELSHLTRNAELMGVDRSPHLIQFARRSARLEGRPAIRFAVMDAHDLKIPGDRFGRVLSTSSIYLWEDPVKGLNEIHRVLRPGGKALVCDHMRADSLGKMYQSVMKQRIFGLGLPAYSCEELIGFFEKSLFPSFRTWTTGMVMWFEAVKDGAGKALSNEKESPRPAKPRP